MSNDFRKLAHLMERLGKERFQILISSDNTGRVKKLCDQILEDYLPSEMLVGGRTYEILNFHKDLGAEANGRTVFKWAAKMCAARGNDDCQHLLDNQKDIPAILKGRFEFVFTDCPYDHDSDSNRFRFVSSQTDSDWFESGAHEVGRFRTGCRLLRNKEGTLPAEMVVVDRTYRIIDYLESGLEEMSCDMMIGWAAAMDIGLGLGEDDGQYLLKHQYQIPNILKEKVVLLFPKWRLYDSNSEKVCFLTYSSSDGRWVLDSMPVECIWRDLGRILDRK